MRRKSIRKIPKGDYCYIWGKGAPDTKNNNFKIRLCPYYSRKYDKKFGGKFSYCKYLHCFGDGAFDDQCKICGIKVPEEDLEIQKAIEEYYDKKNIK